MRLSTSIIIWAALQLLLAPIPSHADLGIGGTPNLPLEEYQATVSTGRFTTPTASYFIDNVELSDNTLLLTITRPTCGRVSDITFRVARESRSELRGKLLLPLPSDDEQYCFVLTQQRIAIPTRAIRKRARGLGMLGNFLRLNVYDSDNKIAATIVLRSAHATPNTTTRRQR